MIPPFTLIRYTDTKGIKRLNDTFKQYGYRITKVRFNELYKLYVQKQCWDDVKERYKWVTIPEDVAWNQLMAIFS